MLQRVIVNRGWIYRVIVNSLHRNRSVIGNYDWVKLLLVGVLQSWSPDTFGTFWTLGSLKHLKDITLHWWRKNVPNQNTHPGSQAPFQECRCMLLHPYKNKSWCFVNHIVNLRLDFQLKEQKNSSIWKAGNVSQTVPVGYGSGFECRSPTLRRGNVCLNWWLFHQAQSRFLHQNLISRPVNYPILILTQGMKLWKWRWFRLKLRLLYCFTPLG